ncbi:MAG: Gfo/Idh/MocA family oxidoreductase [Pirellulales bacterium]|nr:Gfo/Idh/MocA family oxidoreductase [Pirellulales bacterium]
MQAHNPTRRHVLAAAALAAPAYLSAQNTQDEVNAAIIGVGGRGTTVLTRAVKSPKVRFTAICDIDPAARDRGATLAAEWKPDTMSDYRKLLERKDVDAVIIATPVDLHKEMAVAALEAGKSIYLEKPLGLTPQEVKEVVEAAGKAKGILQTGFQLRYDPARRAAIEHIHSGGIGPVAYMQGNRHTGDLPPEKPWLFDASRSGNIIVEQAVHILDLMNWAMKTHPTRAMGLGGINVYKERPFPNRTIWDNYACIFDYPGNVRLSFTHLYIDPRGFSGISERVWGHEGAVDLPSGMKYTLTDRGEDAPPPVKLWEGDAGDMTQNSLDAFYQHVREQSEPLNNVTYGKYATLMAIMGKMAIEQERIVTWDEVDV